MKKVELYTNIQSSVLGFGCASILGSKSFRDSKIAVETALEFGINHFDIARSYGYGEAEAFLGKLIQEKRKNLVIASKFGIQANYKSKLLIPVKPAIRYLKKVLDNKGNIVAVPKPYTVSLNTPIKTDTFHNRIRLDEKNMRKSLEQSLKNLKTDYLDFYFIHEPADSIENIDELTNTAYLLKKEGKIRAWGLAFMHHQQHLHQNYLDVFDVLQFNNSPGMNGYQEICNDRGTKANIFFAPFRSGDPTKKSSEKLKTLLQDFKKSIIICSMFNPLHIKENALLFQ